MIPREWSLQELVPHISAAKVNNSFFTYLSKCYCRRVVRRQQRSGLRFVTNLNKVEKGRSTARQNCLIAAARSAECFPRDRDIRPQTRPSWWTAARWRYSLYLLFVCRLIMVRGSPGSLRCRMGASRGEEGGRQVGQSYPPPTPKNRHSQDFLCDIDLHELVLTFGGSYVCANFGENRSRNATASAHRRTDTLTHWLTDANRFSLGVHFFDLFPFCRRPQYTG